MGIASLCSWIKSTVFPSYWGVRAATHLALCVNVTENFLGLCLFYFVSSFAVRVYIFLPCSDLPKFWEALHVFLSHQRQRNSPLHTHLLSSRVEIQLLLPAHQVFFMRVERAPDVLFLSLSSTFKVLVPGCVLSSSLSQHITNFYHHNISAYFFLG